MSERMKCPKCRGRMVKQVIEVETSETGVLYWRIRGTQPVAYVCGKCGYIELYNTEKTMQGRKRGK
jgi:predicted nucleic-acid-binding Zn-ribbon protein